MSEQITEQEELLHEAQEVQNAENSIPTADSEVAEAPVVAKPKFSKKMIAIIAAAAIAIIAIVIVILIPSKFEKVKKDCCHKAWWSVEDKDYFLIDTYPNEDKFARQYENMNAGVKAMVFAQGQESALEAIRYANEQLGFNDTVYSRMMETSFLMGRQSAENDKYKVSWTYHPDDGLEVMYEKK